MIIKILKIFLWSILGVIITPLLFIWVLYMGADMKEPQMTINPSDYILTTNGDSVLCDNSYLMQDRSGLWELYVVGSGEIRGAKQGILTKDLMKYQEDVFVNQIREIIPSDSYLSLLRSMIIVFNRNIGEAISLEYRSEIAAMSQFCTHQYDAIGTAYERQLNYHAAHDIGHTMQQYMLVGCSSFGVWGDKSDSGSMIIGRNFDFYVGDDFAKNKLLTFAVPDSGYKHASIGWAGMIGVLSGMNERGLTVSINAAKGAIPTSAATPISILTREILQYASTIDQAYQIAKSRQTFVSESILIGSIIDGESAIIEKTPEQTAIYRSEGNQIICTNHFQSKEFAHSSYNIENIEFSDSKYRYDRTEELLNSKPSIDYKDAVNILRDRLGLGGKDVGVGNEMTLNQSIAHHSVVFMPKEGLMWVSSNPWQSGEMVCYNLRDFFDHGTKPYRDNKYSVSADSVFMQEDYDNVLNYRESIKTIKDAIKQNQKLDDSFIDRFMTINPNHFYTYRIIGDYLTSHKLANEAAEMYKRSLNCEIPYKSERIEIESIVKKLSK